MENKNLATYNVHGMHCASCAITIKKTLEKLEGITKVSVNPATNTAQVEGNLNSETLNTSLKPLGYHLQAQGSEMSMPMDDMSMGGMHHHQVEENASLKKPLILAGLGFGIIGLEVAMGKGLLPEGGLLSEFLHHIAPILASYAMFVYGKPYLSALWLFFKTRHANMDTLVGLGTSVAYIYSLVASILMVWLSVRSTFIFHSYYDATIVVIALITAGKIMEERAKKRTNQSLS